MKIEINLKIIFVLIFLFMFDNMNTYLVFLFFILIHEIAHLIVGICIGGIPKKMNISIFGVSIEFYSYGKNKTLYKVIFYLIGPAINLLMSFIFYKIMKKSEVKDIFVITNFAIGIFNLLPILPLDGGKILKEVFRYFFGFDISNRIMMFISKLFLIIASFTYSVLIIKIKNIMILFLLVYLWYLYAIEEKKYNLYLKTKSVIKNII